MKINAIVLAGVFLSSSAFAACPLGCCKAGEGYSFHRLSGDICRSNKTHDQLCEEVRGAGAYSCSRSADAGEASVTERSAVGVAPAQDEE